jgi:CheY-like chemotaxis protein
MPGSARVLVIDDSPTILKVVSAILARHGYEPAVARDGTQGIELIKKGTKYDIVLLDFVMPRMNGYQFCRELRSNPAHRTLPVVLMSAKGDKIRGQFVQQTGAVDAITKPFDARALVAVIEGALSKTAEGRARPVPEGNKMPDEDTIADSVRPSWAPKQSRMRAAVELAQQIGSLVAPAVISLPERDRANEAAILGAVARAMTNEAIEQLAGTFKEVEAESKEVMGGDIAAIPLAEILQVLQMQRQSGVVRITNQRASIQIWIRQGLVDFVSSRGQPEEFRLGRYFVQKGLATRDQIDAVVSAKLAPGKLLGEMLVEEGLATREELGDALTRQSSELIYDVLRWPYGRFSFTREPFKPEAEAARLGLGIAGLVLEGFRRVDEWRLMEGTINFDQTIILDAVALDSVGEGKLTQIDKLIVAAVNGQRSVNEVLKESLASPFDGIKSIYQLLQSRVLRPRSG